MFDGIVYGLITAWILSLFDVDDGFIRAIQPFLQSIEITTDHYYLCFGLIGMIGGLISGIIKSLH